jgi:UDP-N-acetylmuramoylalanine--D-glutamate ligase
VLVVGLARSGQEAALCLSRRGAVVTVTDLKPPSAFQDIIPELATHKIGVELGRQPEDTFLRHDLIVVSPGVPWDLPQFRAAREKGIPIFPEIEAASWFLSGRLIGITGTNGKSTTTALLGRILEASGFSTFVGGNIGVPLISLVDQTSPDSLVVAELSSYQLEGIENFRPRVAVLLNITPHHMDRHNSFGDYVQSKARLFRNQQADDCAILNADDPNVMNLEPAIASRKLFFSRRQSLREGVFLSNGQVRYRVNHLERALLETRDVPLPGDFNLENVMAAAAAACALGADFEALPKAVRAFKSLPHRLEFVREIRGVDFYNDSKATSIDADSKALSAFERGVHLILGGKDEGTPSGALRPWLKDRVRAVYLIGAAAERFGRELSGAAELILCGDLERAVRKAFERARPADVVLLAPACPSFDQFQDFEHRGRVFKELVEQLAESSKSSASRVAEIYSKEPELSLRAESSNPELQHLSPEPSPPGPEQVYIYEVAAEEVTALDNLDSESGGDELELLEAANLRRADVLKDEPLPFEVRASEAALNPTKGSKRGAPRKGSSRQSRLPGI